MSFLDNIKAIPITDYAQRCGFTLVKKGQRYVSLKEHDSVMIDTQKNCFWRNSVFHKGVHGGAGSIIDFAMEFMGYEQKQAMRELAVMYGIEGDKAPTKPPHQMPQAAAAEMPKREVGDLDLPKAADNVKAVYRYLLNERKIDISVVRYFLAKKMLYQSEKYHNCVFVSNRFACVRSTGGKRFVADLQGCDYDECFYFKGSADAKKLIVCESVIDLMSIMTEFVRRKERYINYCYLALAGTNKLPSLYYHLKKEPEIDHVYLAFDNDEAGKLAEQEAIAGLKEMGYAGSVTVFAAPAEKDWNAYIQATST